MTIATDLDQVLLGLIQPPWGTQLCTGFAQRSLTASKTPNQTSWWQVQLCPKEPCWPPNFFGAPARKQIGQIPGWSPLTPRLGRPQPIRMVETASKAEVNQEDIHWNDTGTWRDREGGGGREDKTVTMGYPSNPLGGGDIGRENSELSQESPFWDT